jgi:hypothetical protein
MFLVYEIKGFERFLISKSLLKQFSETSDLWRGGLEIKPFYKLFPNRLFGQKMFSNCGYVEFEIILMKTFCNWFLQDFSSQVVLKFCLNNEGGWVAKLLNSRVDRVFEKQGKINASLENEIFWKPLFYKSNAPYFLNDFKLKYFESHFSFEDKGLLPFYLSQTKLVLKMFWNHFLFEKVKLSQSNFVFGNLSLNKTFEARFLESSFWFCWNFGKEFGS